MQKAYLLSCRNARRQLLTRNQLDYEGKKRLTIKAELARRQ